MPWDPLATWPKERKWIWATFAFWVIILRGPEFVGNFDIYSWEQRGFLPDFFQEWASARNYYEGIPIYTEHKITLERYLNVKIDPQAAVLVNAHPPASVLLALPFGKLSFGNAFLLWNLVSMAALFLSLGLIVRGMRIPFTAFSLLPLTSILLLCSPLWQQCKMGQLNLFLLLLLVGTWAAGRSGRPWLAGSLLGVATALKLFPGLLFLYYLARREWKTVSAGLLSLLALTFISIFLFGLTEYTYYFAKVLPDIHWFRVDWGNPSLWGFFSRLFDPAPEHERTLSLTRPLFYSPFLARLGGWVSSLIITGIMAYQAQRSKSLESQDKAFGISLIAMVLISHICWNHYFLILILPLALIWINLPQSRTACYGFLLVFSLLLLNPGMLWSGLGIEGKVAGPLLCLTINFISFLFINFPFNSSVKIAEELTPRLPAGPLKVRPDPAPLVRSML